MKDSRDERLPSQNFASDSRSPYALFNPKDVDLRALRRSRHYAVHPHGRYLVARGDADGPVPRTRGTRRGDLHGAEGRPGRAPTWLSRRLVPGEKAAPSLRIKFGEPVPRGDRSLSITWKTGRGACDCARARLSTRRPREHGRIRGRTQPRVVDFDYSPTHR